MIRNVDDILRESEEVNRREMEDEQRKYLLQHLYAREKTLVDRIAELEKMMEYVLKIVRNI